ncbi:chaplin [Streptomyces sp. KR80]|uniref:chaplin n=1 Tax=Streptomyces sp. KR80 TaxID=3457426 RepID=UPI003FD03CDE
MSRIVKAAAVTAAAGAMLAGSAGAAAADAKAKGFAAHSPGVLSGNVVQIPIHIPINACGNKVIYLVGVLDPAFGNVCINDGHHKHKKHRHHKGLSTKTLGQKKLVKKW